MTQRRRTIGFAVLAAAIATAPAAGQVAKKRAAPSPVEPVSLGGLRYEALPWGKGRGLPQNGGHVVAIDEATGRELWVARVYRVAYDRRIEGDKQDVFITRLAPSPDGAALIVENERGARYRFDLRTRKARPE